MEKEKLTIEHLAPYFPYNLLGLSSRNTFFYLGINSNLLGNGIETRGINIFLNEQFKPLLYPLSMLTKEIEVRGKRFIPMKVLFSLTEEEEKEFDVYGIIPQDFENAVHVGLKHWEYWRIKLMHKWHIDTDNLIGKGLAIDKTTIQ